MLLLNLVGSKVVHGKNFLLFFCNNLHSEDKVNIKEYINLLIENKFISLHLEVRDEMKTKKINSSFIKQDLVYTGDYTVALTKEFFHYHPTGLQKT